jgi:hypothetical protein
MQCRMCFGVIQKEWRSEDEGQVALVFLPQAMLNRLLKLSDSGLFEELGACLAVISRMSATTGRIRKAVAHE